MIEDAHRLLSFQLAQERELDNKYKFAGLSVDQFISRLLAEGFSKRAEKVRVDWKVPDKRWWWVKLKALAGIKDWEGLEAFAKSKKSPIGYEPFVVSLIPFWGWTSMSLIVLRLIYFLSLLHSQRKRRALFLGVILRPERTYMSFAEIGVRRQMPLARPKTRQNWSMSFPILRRNAKLIWFRQLRRSAPNGIAQREVDEVIRRMK